MEQSAKLKLQIALQVDQQVAAGDEVEADEWGALTALCEANSTRSRTSLGMR